MKKTLIIGLISLLSIVLVYGFADAKVTGACVNCHTMHNSQNNLPMTFGASTTPIDALLRGTCIGCHSDTSTNTIRAAGTVPIVWNTAGGTTDPGTAQSWSGATYNLAGGNFHYVVTSHSKGHNVENVAPIDSSLGNTPPGYLSTRDPATTKYTTGSRLACAGSYGCHGNRNVTGSYAGVKGAHHGDSTPIDGSTTAKSYRFLGSATLSTYSVLGLEDPNWQQSASVTDHNEYKGATTQAVTNTISYLCGHCHGNFHASAGIGTASPWLRHPTDTDVIAKGGEYANYGFREGTGGTIAGTYILEAPVGYVTTPTSPRSTVLTGDSPVTCISCHRAHGSPYDDILRWDYSTMLAGGPKDNVGCFTCHTAKDD